MKSVLDSRQLLAARVLADTGSFTLAGQQLSLTQSAVSHAIKALEEEVECKLFARTGKGVVVTPAGKHFLQYLDRILEHMETARTLVAPRTARGKERLRLGVSMRAREHILPIVLPAFHKDYPNRLVTIEPGDYRRNLELLESGLLDLSFAVKPAGRADLSYVHLFEDELRFMVAPSHPWAKAGRAKLEDLATDALLVHQQYNRTGELLAEHLSREKIVVQHSVELHDYEPIRDFVRTGRAIGVIPPWLVAAELRAGSIVSLPIGSAPLVRQWGLVYDPKRPLTPMDRRFIELCLQAVPGILSRLQGPRPEPREKKAIIPVNLAGAVPAVSASA